MAEVRKHVASRRRIAYPVRAMKAKMEILGEGWNSRLGVILAVAGSAVGLGNFLRFPGQAVANAAAPS